MDKIERRNRNKVPILVLLMSAHSSVAVRGQQTSDALESSGHGRLSDGSGGVSAVVSSRLLLWLSCMMALLALSSGTAFSQDWPPHLDMNNRTTAARDGRTIERYVHGARASWGYPVANRSEWQYPVAQETGAAQQNINSFYIVFPKEPRAEAPLYVVLHSANRTAFDYLAYGTLGRKIDQGNDPESAVTNVPEGFFGLYLNSTNAEWWGWTEARKNAAAHNVAAPSAELRVLDTIEWVVQRYHIDRDRIYLTGVSMGGNGSLGIGLRNGDIFAAMRVTVPAGTGFASYSMGGFAPSPAEDASQSERDTWLEKASGKGLPDPPVTVDLSSPVDMWSMTQPALLQAAQGGHLPLVVGWGPFGHTAFGSEIAKSPECDVVLAFPWLHVRKDAAYPAFTHASTDQESPWLNGPADFDSSGQMNAYFRWKNEEDTAQVVAMQLWIVHPPVNNPPPAMPEAATADVTLRRLQHFRTTPGTSYAWRAVQDQRVVASGTVTPDASNLITIHRLMLTTTPLTLRVEDSSLQPKAR